MLRGFAGLRVVLYRDEDIVTDKMSELEEPTYIPDGFEHVEGTTMETGFVVKDSDENEYVWIEVPKVRQLYKTAGTEITEFTDEEYTKIENDLITYTELYRQETTFTDTYFSNTGLTEEGYKSLKKDMLKSIYRNAGFYVGRYETGKDSDGSAAIKKNLDSYTSITIANAQTTANTFAPEGFTGSLMFGVQWDLVLRYLEEKGVDQTELYSDSSSWGNGGTYRTIKTGSNETYKKQNIYDLAGNVLEWTLECGSTTTSVKNVSRGAYWYSAGDLSYLASKAGYRGATNVGSHGWIGYRVSLFRDPNIDPGDLGGISSDNNPELVVDVVDPIWRVQNAQQTTTDGITTVTMDIIGTDKFFKKSTLQKDDIQLIMSGVNIAEVDGEGNQTVLPTLERDLSAPVYIKWNNENGTYVETTEDKANGVKYVYTATNIVEPDADFLAERAKYAADNSTGRVYQEYSGPIKIQIPAEKLEDQSENKNIVTPLNNIIHVDTIKPKVIKVSSTPQINATNVELSKHIIVFDIVDKYLDTSAITTEDTSNIHVYLDGELTEIDTNNDGVVDTDTVTKTITRIEQLNATVGEETRKVGYRYTLELSGFENARTAINYTREYTDWSGDLTIKIDENTAYDANPNNPTDRRGNDETILAGNEANTSNVDYADFVDYIKPDATYEYAETDVDYYDREFTMVFDITDKYFYSEDTNANGVLDAGEDINGNNKIDDSAELKLEDLQIYIDGYEDDMNLNPNITKSFRVEDVKNEVLGQTKVIGKRYTLILSHLEQIQKIEGNNYLDYSGAVSVIIPKDKVKDTSNNGNDVTSIKSGINIPGGSVDDLKNIDVVKPLWEKESFTVDINNKTATINILGTDKYFWQDDETTTDDDKYSTLTNDEIKLYVNGMETTGNIVISDPPTKLTEERNENGETKIVQYGVRYQITLTDFSIDKNQVKLQLVEGALVDQSDNKSPTKDLMIYNTLISTATETEATSTFLNEIAPEGKTPIARQDIQQVIFVDSIEASKAETVQNVWDASAQRDRSILAWYSETEAPYTVYVGSKDDIYGNLDSSYLFSYIGYGEDCNVATPVTNLAALHTENVTKMSYMFSNFGYRKMITLNLGNFYTENVTNMSGMFNNCGSLLMTTLNLGTTFNTSKVTNMSSMFKDCGATALGTLDLGAAGVTFDTTLVNDMSNMFNGCGVSALTTFSLGNNFKTTAENLNMSGMFQNFGHKLSSFTLGPNFNTTTVTNMNSMFKDFAKTSTTLTSLDLGETFYTSAVTDMTNMFNGCGNTAMTSIDLGPAFTNIAETNAGFVTNCGVSGAIINAPESIYNDMKHFKLSTDSTTTIEYTQGTINPKYKPEWSKVSSTLTIEEAENLEDSTMTIVVNGKVNTTVYENAIQTVTSPIIAGNDALNLINVYVDGQLAESIKQTIVVNTAPENQVQYTITLSNFQEEVRQSTKNFKEWAGNVALQFTRGTLLDAYGNKNMTQIDVDPDGDGITEIQQIQIKDTGTLDANVETDKMFADYIKPEFTYEFANTEIGSGPEGDKKVKVVFDVTDKYFNSTELEDDSNAELITVLVDGELPGDTNGDLTIGAGETLAITKTLTKTAIFVMNKETKEITSQDTDYEIQTTEQKVGERYELLIDNIQQDPNDSSHFSGVFTLSFDSGIIDDKSGNENDATTITIGVDETGDGSGLTGGQGTAKKPIDLFDSTGSVAGKLHIGDFVNYDAGTWTQQEIDAIKVGPKDALVKANGSTEVPEEDFQFGGFAEGSSRNGTAEEVIWQGYTYIKDENGDSVAGWRVFDINDDGKVTLISAGNPENYCDMPFVDDGYIHEYILSGNVNDDWINADTSLYQKRDWENYVNEKQKAESATPLTKSQLDNWYSKYITPNADTYTEEDFKKIYEEPYFKYQNIIDNYSMYYLANALRGYMDSGLDNVKASTRRLATPVIYGGSGIRILVTLSPDVLFLREPTGTKTLSGGNMDTYGGPQTYNVWDIKQPETYEKPSDLYADGKLHIGDFVNYDAGTWTQEEIDAIQVGPKDALVTASGSIDLPSNTAAAAKFQFLGFEEGSSRNGNATPIYSTFNYIKDESEDAVTGWRVFDIDGDTVTLISAGTPEDYTIKGPNNGDGYVNEFILTGEVNDDWNVADITAYQKRDWSNYVNQAQKGKNATVLTKSALDEWYGKYLDVGENADSFTIETFQKIYEEQYINYQNLIDNYSFYWLRVPGAGGGLRRRWCPSFSSF